MASGILSPSPRPIHEFSIRLVYIPLLCSTQAFDHAPGDIDHRLAVFAGLPGFEAFHFVDVAQLAVLDDEVQLAVFAELGQQIIDFPDLRLIQEFEPEPFWYNLLRSVL